MTREEASKVIKDGLEDMTLDYIDNEQYEALTMAIKALEQEPCNTDTCKVVKAYMNEWDKPNNTDAISRRKAIIVISGCDGKSAQIEALEQLPSVNPQEPKWIPVSERLPEEDGDYFVTYEKGYAEDYDLTPVGIAGFEVDCESFGYWYEHFDRQTLGSLGSEWEEIKVIAWMPLPERYEPQESEE